MKIQFSFVGDATLLRRVYGEADLWVDLDGVPREGEVVHVPHIPEHLTVVRTVVWFPLGHDAEGDDEPFVYVVLGEPRRPA